MRNRKVSLAIAAIAGGGTLLAAAPASALISRYQSAGYSQDIQSRTTMVACDTQADGNGVYANWWETNRTNYDTLTNNQGSGTCNVAATSSTEVVRAHIIWINLSGRPDPHGPYVSY